MRCARRDCTSTSSDIRRAVAPAAAVTSLGTRAVSRSGSTANGASVVEIAHAATAAQRIEEGAKRPVAMSADHTNTGASVAAASLSMFTESGVQTMRFACASRPA
jgi:hypothetical protein